MSNPNTERNSATKPASADDSNNPPCATIDEEALYTSLRDRVDYLTAFLDFTLEDVEHLNDISLLLEPLVNGLVDKVYAHLFTFDVTKTVFMPTGTVENGPVLTDLHHLTLDAPQIIRRKRFFGAYIRKLVSADYNDFGTWQYFDKVGIMHTGAAGLKHRQLAGKEGLHVDLIHLTALLAWTMDALTPVILNEPSMTTDAKIATIRALNKVMWIQNDLFSRHYTVRAQEVKFVLRGEGEGSDDRTASSGHRTMSSTSGEDWMKGPEVDSVTGRLRKSDPSSHEPLTKPKRSFFSFGS